LVLEVPLDRPEVGSASPRAIARFARFRQASEQYTRGRLPSMRVIGVPQ
jgi:hypothetical protein